MTFLFVPDKNEYLKKNKIADTFPIVNYNGDVECIHCGKIINMMDYKVEISVPPPPSVKEIQNRKKAEKLGLPPYHYSSEPKEYIVCPNAPECDGTIIDWRPITNYKQ